MSTPEIRFDNQVVVVTGAGAGLGRAYALLFAERGAKVVVNDLGGSRDGSGNSTSAADQVVEEIKQKGWTAVPDYNSVVDGNKLIETAIKHFGRIDILINNAGILRDRSFQKMSDQDWDLINNVHLKGSFKTTQAAWPYFKKQKYGRIIMTASNSGLYGNFGQANYSAAKMGLVGLAQTLAIEGANSNIHCNVIVPTAASRLTEDILPPDIYSELKPHFIAPIVVYLCHESCTTNGAIIDSAIGWAGKVHLVRSKGKMLRAKNKTVVTPEEVRNSWAQIIDMSKATRFNSIQEVTSSLVDQISDDLMTENDDSSKTESVFSYSSKDLILYALSVGCSTRRPNELKFLYENDEDFTFIPSFFINPGLIVLMSSDMFTDLIPGKSIDFTNILHGEQYLEVVDFEAILSNTNGMTLKTDCKIVDIVDKKSGAVISVDANTYDENGKLIIYNQFVLFAVGAGNFGGEFYSKNTKLCVPKPKRNPDIIQSQETTVDQAALYRLCADLNPLHIDVNVAKISGYSKPIMHGLCSLGFSLRHVLEHFANNNITLFKSLKARFTKPVYPGETLITNMWRDGNRIHFETTVKERNVVIISGAYVDLKEIHTKISSKL